MDAPVQFDPLDLPAWILGNVLVCVNFKLWNGPQFVFGIGIAPNLVPEPDPLIDTGCIIRDFIGSEYRISRCNSRV